MKSIKIPFNYFYKMFQDEFCRTILEIEKSRIGEPAEELSEIFDFYTTTVMPNHERVSIYNQVLFDICANYVTLSNSSINIYPKDSLEFVNLILDTMHEDPYQESFLLSLQFIYQDYLDCLGKGRPILMSSEDTSSLSSLQITLDSHYQITEFDSINMNIIDQAKIMTKIISMENNKQIGPIPQVGYRIRKDI